MSRWLMLVPLAALLVFGAADTAVAGGDWNDQEIKWRTYDDGLAEAKKSKKPVMLIFFTEWCPHCKNYSGVFHDPKVVAKSKDFVMIRLDADKNKELSEKYAVDGSYIPRTYFLASNGTLSDIHAPREQFKYFYDEHNPASILAGMEAAQKQLK
jgi:thiol-disulfide isomerase/thioredoxin